MSVIRFLLSMILFTVPFWAVGVYLLYRGFTAGPTALTDDGYDLKTFFFEMGGFFTGLPFLFIFISLIVAIRKRNKIKEIVTYGKQGTAKVLKLSDTGVLINDNPRVKLLLEISIPNYPTYQAEKTLDLSIVYLPRVQPGSIVNILADPNEPNNENRIGLVLE
ncbi:MAG: hypothetical protein AAB336_09995 [Acidobacteriota bacterium]